MLIPSSKINDRLVECALDSKRKCCFPYMETKRHHGLDLPSNRMSDDQIQEFVDCIPQDVLANSFYLFRECLGYNVLKFYPLTMISYQDINKLLANDYLSNKDKIALAASIPYEKWTEDFGRAMNNNIKLKGRPTYCSLDLWTHIRSY